MFHHCSCFLICTYTYLGVKITLASTSKEGNVNCCMLLMTSTVLMMICRTLERVHAAVLGEHVRHECFLPLEMYLEEGIPLVCYMRDKGFAEMVELPQQSCHAFLTFSNMACDPPPLKVSAGWLPFLLIFACHSCSLMPAFHAHLSLPLLLVFACHDCSFVPVSHAHVCLPFMLPFACHCIFIVPAIHAQAAPAI